MIHLRPVPRRLGSSFPSAPGMGLATLVASTQRSRSGAMSFPVMRSLSPFVYTSAVSMKFTPASRPAATIRPDSAASVRSPNIMVPRQMGETYRPLSPSLRYSIVPLSGKPGSDPECFNQVEAGADAGEVERDLRRFVGRVVVLVVGGEGNDDGRQAEQVREDEVGRRSPEGGHHEDLPAEALLHRGLHERDHRMVEGGARRGRGLQAPDLDAVVAAVAREL